MENLAVDSTSTQAAAATPKTGETQAAASDVANNPEETKEESKGSGFIYHGMGNVQNKNTVQKLESRKETWSSLNVPANIEAGLAKLNYYKPSIIQAASIPKIMASPNVNFAFQAMNGSGKTGAFVVPAMMRVDTSVLKVQIIIMANTRELIRQITQVIEVLASETEVKTILGERGQTEVGHILVTVPGYLKNKLVERGSKLDLSALKMVVYDEADELFDQRSNHECFNQLKKSLSKINVAPQHCLYSATYTDTVVDFAKTIIGDYKYLPIKKEAQKLKGVKHFKM